MIWDDAAKKKLAKFWASGLSCSQIAKEMGVTRNAIIGKANRMKLPSRKVEKSLINNLGYKIVRKAIEDHLYKSKYTAKLLKTFKTKRNEPKQIVLVFRTTSDAVMALKDDLCKYPHGEPGKPNFRFCLKPVNGKSVYCSEHQGSCYMPTRYPIVRAGKFMK